MPGRSGRGSLGAADLKRRMLGLLLAFPALAREFNADLAERFLDAPEPVDRQIVEVWRAATSAASVSSGALLEVLAASEHATVYTTLAVGGLASDEDLGVARDELQAAFRQLELRRLREELDLLVRQPEQEGAHERIRELLERQSRVKAALAAPAADSPRSDASA
jgi:DNA primase